MSPPVVRGLYCLRCSSRKVVRGNFEAERFYPVRGLVRALLGKPVTLRQEHAHACLDCGLAWNELDPHELRRNVREHGLSPHSTVVMQVVQGRE